MLRRSFVLGCAAAAALLLGSAQPSTAADRFITVASTTSTEDSGLFKSILPKFTEKTGIEVRVVAKGTGQAIDIAKRGDADVLFVHHKPSEDKFVAEGFSTERKPVMYNDFVIVGPKADPAKVGGSKDVSAALKGIAAAKAPFVSRGDDSGTHKSEQALWKTAGVDPTTGDGWYRAIGQGMGATLNTAAAVSGYAMTDRATWLSFKNRGDLDILVEGDKRLFNQYGVMLVNPAKFSHVKAADGQAFVDWLVSAEGQQAIADYTINGNSLFFPNANEPGV
ncbi:sulfate transporter [Azospirillum brasilense]|uniref:Substrate-binding domain-containing protein n=1 Tax=Azospirillum brasilense TaxID=192 RepID=A0A4D8QWW7_AZOBR|nr:MULTISPECIES: substrate-binding domain-containing protein [Azospirillum]MDW7554771.1 substrate-binding domain-containing protein [Azospirillum brasilense]MDW7557194.1 substrate-binding domain-containing protein [Azospirillum brasilense]MDW7593106.1 substrate-binding domain-containing protein [Azospirillum brasilense]MDW7626943.1 substrate-binding domain-containing protein [Azospirillum brasilense]MDX5953353.1 substrate-binding domain-containing protein [Azospirillum brasilense]